MRLDGMGINPQFQSYEQQNVGFTPLREFATCSLSTKVEQEKTGGLKKAFRAIIGIPMMILNGVWTGFKYAIYLVSCCKLCKPEHNYKKMKAALEEYQKASDPQAGWEKFNKNFPGGFDMLVKFSIEHQREQELGAKGSMDPKRVREWDKANYATKRENFLQRFKDQDEEIINSAVDYLQKVIEAKEKK